jgi:hypothetical protein
MLGLGGDPGSYGNHFNHGNTITPADAPSVW